MVISQRWKERGMVKIINGFYIEHSINLLFR